VRLDVTRDGDPAHGHPADRSAVVRPLRPPVWDWSFFEDGALALDRHELWDEPVGESRLDLSQSPRRPPRLKALSRSVTFPPMPRPRPPGASSRARSRRAARRVRRLAVLTIVTSLAVVTLVLTAFGSSTPASVVVPALPSRLMPDTPPQAQIVALHGPIRVQLPVAQARLTAIGYHSSPGGGLSLEPLGTQGNRGLLRRLADRVFGATSDALVYYRLDGGGSPNVLDVGAAPGTDVFSPVDGVVVGITDYVLSGKPHGVRVDVQPATAPSLVVSVTRLRADPALTVGMSVAAGTSKIGTVLDLSRLERQALARFTQDAGNHVSLEVHAAPTLTLR
jgi:hypothetical protein